MDSTQSRFWAAAVTLGLALAYIVNSAGLIAFNKYLLHEDRFPFAIMLVFLHMVGVSILSTLLFLIRPSLFPAISSPAPGMHVDLMTVVKGFFPVGLFFGTTLILTNKAMLYCSIAFLQMMKEGNLVLVYVFSIAAGLEYFSWTQSLIGVWIIVGCTLCIHGELHFVWLGFMMQFCGQITECMKLVVQQFLLSGQGYKFDALSFVLYMAPVSALIIAVPMVFFESHPMVWARIQALYPFLLANICVAFSLNIVVAMFIKHTSAVSFMLAGLVKDTVIVVASVLIFGDAVSALQQCGFFMQLVGVMAVSIVKAFPHCFKDGFWMGFYFVARELAGSPIVPIKAGEALPSIPEEEQPVVEECKPESYGATK
mmetsp:Transcript_31008/g.68100  ORF Transcript_31008/g.68100 Transcript_31008/m.68100 type:complete len:369 (+) Transcript_31008:101-1207(+)